MEAAFSETFDMSEIDRKFFQSPDGPRVLLGFKVPASLRESLDALVQFWKLRARVEKSHSLPKEDPKRAEKIQAAVDAIDLTYVCNRLLAVGVDGSWGQMLADAELERIPVTEDEWEKLERYLVEQTKRTPRPSSKR